MKKNKNVYDGAEMVPENVENTHKKGKSLTGRIFRWMCLAVGGSLMLVCIINILLSYTYLKQALVNEMDEVVHTASNTISNQLESVVNAITQISADAIFLTLQMYLRYARSVFLSQEIILCMSRSI